MAVQKKGRLYHYLGFRRDRLHDAEPEDDSPTLKRYFKLLGRKFWKLVSLNLMMLPQILPLLLGIYLYLSMDKTPSGNSYLFPQLFGANLVGTTPATVGLLDVFGAQLDIPVYSVWSYIWIGVCVLVLAVTFGWQNCGATYVLRSMVRGEPVFLFTDYFYAVKRNLKQGLFLGLLDFAILFFLGFDLYYFWNQTGSFWTDVYFWAICALIILYFFMRFYLYLLQITFHLSIRKILKNALIFSVLGVKRNLMALLGIVAVTAINIFLFYLFGMTPLGIAIPLIIPFLYYLAVTAFTACYAAYPIIDRYMIAPYRQKEETEEAPTQTEET